MLPSYWFILCNMGVWYLHMCIIEYLYPWNYVFFFRNYREKTLILFMNMVSFTFVWFLESILYCLIGLYCVIWVFDTFICALLSIYIPEILYFLRNYREKNINLVHEPAIICLCLILGKYPSMTTGKISWHWPNYINPSKLGIFIIWGVVC